MITSWKDITAEQYLLISSSKDDKEIIKSLFGKELNQIPIRYFEEGALDFLKANPVPVDVTTFILENKVYKLVPLDKISMGEYIDLTTYSETWQINIWKMMCILYRPIKGLNLKSRFKSWWGNRLIKGGTLLGNQKLVKVGVSLISNLDYTTEKYDPDHHLQNEQDFKKMPADQFYSFLLFFSLLSTKRTLDTLKSLSPTKKKTRKTNPLKPS